MALPLSKYTGAPTSASTSTSRSGTHTDADAAAFDNLMLQAARFRAQEIADAECAALRARAAEMHPRARARARAHDVCARDTCTLVRFARGDAYGENRRASGDYVLCAESARVHVCGDEQCSAAVATMSGSVCTVTGRERAVLFQYTLGASRGSTTPGAFARPDGVADAAATAAATTTATATTTTTVAEMAQRVADESYVAGVLARRAAARGPVGAVPAAEGRARAAAPTPASEFDGAARTRAERAAAATTVVAGHAVSAGGAAALRALAHGAVGDATSPTGPRRRRTDAYFENVFYNNIASKRDEAERIVRALVFSAASADACRRAAEAPYARAAESAIAYIAACEQQRVRPNACAIYERVAAHVQHARVADRVGAALPTGPRAPSAEPHLVDYYVRACMHTWHATCGAAAASRPDAKKHPSFSKHCIGVLYHLQAGLADTVRVGADDFAAAAAAQAPACDIVQHVVFLERDALLGAALPPVEALDAVLAACEIAGDMKYVREGKSMIRECYASLVAERRAALRAALAALPCDAAPTLSARAVADFFESVRAVEFARVVGAPPARYVLTPLRAAIDAPY
jgi:hypothetical protein